VDSQLSPSSPKETPSTILRCSPSFKLLKSQRSPFGTVLDASSLESSPTSRNIDSRFGGSTSCRSSPYCSSSHKSRRFTRPTLDPSGSSRPSSVWLTEVCSASPPSCVSSGSGFVSALLQARLLVLKLTTDSLFFRSQLLPQLGFRLDEPNSWRKRRQPRLRACVRLSYRSYNLSPCSSRPSLVADLSLLLFRSSRSSSNQVGKLAKAALALIRSPPVLDPSDRSHDCFLGEVSRLSPPFFFRACEI